MGDGEALTGEVPFWEGASTCSPLTLGRLGLFDASLLACCLASRLGEGGLSHVRDSSRDPDPSTWGVLGGDVCLDFFFLLLFFLEESEGEDLSVDTNSSWSGFARCPPLSATKL